MWNLNAQAGRSEAQWLRLLFEDGSSQPFPSAPDTIAGAGVNRSTLEQLLLKILYNRGDLLAQDLADAVGLKFRLFQSLILEMRDRGLVHSSRPVQPGFTGDVGAIFSITRSGRECAQRYLEVNQYSGPAPVPLEQYARMVVSQRRAVGWLTFEKLKTAYSKIVVTQELLHELEPAVHSRRPLLIQGKPRDGKTSFALALAELEQPPVFIPYALEHQGNIVQVYDPVLHERTESPEPEDGPNQEALDGRWVRCRRPFIISGADLTLEMLEPAFNAETKVYQAPLQLKANNGVYLVDDFGSQKFAPGELVGRWMLSLERGIERVNLLAGEPIETPVEAMLILCGNLTPEQLSCEALRHEAVYRLPIPPAQETEFREIFRRCCSGHAFTCNVAVLDRFIEKQYRAARIPFRRADPRGILSHAIDLIEFGGRPHELTVDLLEDAYRAYLAHESAASTPNETTLHALKTA